MTDYNKARQALEEFSAKFGPAVFFEGTVVKIDKEQYLADIETETDVVYHDCRLRAVVSSNSSMDVLPEVGANVVMGKIDDGDFIVIACDKITSYKVTVGTTTQEIDKDGHQMQKGNETLGKILNEMVDQMLKVYAPKDVPGITAIKQRINTLLK